MENQMNTTNNYPLLKVGERIRDNKGRTNYKIESVINVFNYNGTIVACVGVSDGKKFKELFVDPKNLKILHKEMKRFLQEQKLLQWIKMNQQLYKEGKLSKEQIEKLNSFGTFNGKTWLEI